jgi:AbrB family looped-hinge helix DNA binding protein
LTIRAPGHSVTGGEPTVPKSTLTVRYQTTVPKEVREKLGLRADDELQWEVSGDHAEVKPSRGGHRRKAPKPPPGAGAFDSGHTDTADRAEELLGPNEPSKRVGHALDRFIGTWSVEQEAEVLKAIEIFEQVDDSFWR